MYFPDSFIRKLSTRPLPPISDPFGEEKVGVQRAGCGSRKVEMKEEELKVNEILKKREKVEKSMDVEIVKSDEPDIKKISKIILGIKNICGDNARKFG